MIRNLKALGLALVAAFAMSAMAASAASATAFDSEAHHTILEGSQVGTNIFETGAGITECEEAIFEGTVTGTSSTGATIEPTFDECKTFGLDSEVDMNGCDFLITAHGQVHVEGCDPGEHIEITVLPDFTHDNNETTEYFCSVTVFEQTVGGITFQNTGSGSTRDIDVHATSTGITYEVDGGEGLCGEEHATAHDGSYTGTVTVEGRDTVGGHVGINHTS